MADRRSRTRDRGPRPIEYELPGGWKVLVGRPDADNDRPLARGRMGLLSLPEDEKGSSTCRSEDEIFELLEGAV
jgi:hypothetical protein